MVNDANLDHVMKVRHQKNMFVLPVTRPTLENGTDPRLVFTNLKAPGKHCILNSVLLFGLKTRCSDHIWHIDEENMTILHLFFENRIFPSIFPTKTPLEAKCFKKLKN